MSQCHKDAKAKRKRRMGYQTALERKCALINAENIAIGDMLLHAKNKMNEAIASEKRMAEVFSGVLNKKLLIEVAKWEGRGEELECRLRYNDPAVYLQPPLRRDYTMENAGMDIAQIKPIKLESGTLTLRHVIDGMYAKRNFSGVDYLEMLATEMGQRVGHEILGKLLADIGDMQRKAG